MSNPQMTKFCRPGLGIVDYIAMHRKGQRRGQAFFNCLAPEYQEKLRGTKYDPFSSDDWSAIQAAINYLEADSNE